MFKKIIFGAACFAGGVFATNKGYVSMLKEEAEKRGVDFDSEDHVGS